MADPRSGETAALHAFRVTSPLGDDELHLISHQNLAATAICRGCPHTCARLSGSIEARREAAQYQRRPFEEGTIGFPSLCLTHNSEQSPKSTLGGQATQIGFCRASGFVDRLLTSVFCRCVKQKKWVSYEIGGCVRRDYSLRNLGRERDVRQSERLFEITDPLA
jgi:hypothetical protein